MFGIGNKANEQPPIERNELPSPILMTNPHIPALEVPPETPPADNAHVVEGGEQFPGDVVIPEGTIDEGLAATLPPVEDEIDPEGEQSASSQEAFGSDDFHAFIAKNVIKFLSIMDIADEGRRRAAIISLHLGEEGIVERLELAEAFFALQVAYGLDAGITNLVEESAYYTDKIAAMKQWLGL